MDNVLPILWAFSRGFIDSVRGTVYLFYLDNSVKEKAKQQTDSPRHRSNLTRQSSQPKHKSEEPNIRITTAQCCALNGGLFYLSMFLFDNGVLPVLHYLIVVTLGESPSTIQNAWSWIQTLLSGAFSALWVMPLFLLSKIVSGLWFMDIAAVAFKHSRGRPQAIISVSRAIADTIFSVPVQCLFLIQAMIVGAMPLPLVFILKTVHMAMLYSLYAFEYKWASMGWELHKRLSFIENNWPYFIGFGLPLELITCLTDSYFVSGCLFSMVFPLFIVSANAADPILGIPEDRPLRLFSLVIYVSNWIMRCFVRVARYCTTMVAN